MERWQATYATALDTASDEAIRTMTAERRADLQRRWAVVAERLRARLGH